MQLASHGARALKPTGGGAIRHTNHSAPSRSIHIPSFAPRPYAGQGSSTAQTLFRHTRTFFSRFVTHLTTPGTLRIPIDVPTAARPLYHSASRMPTIQQGLSLHARTVLSRPLNAPRLPRAPAVPRGVSQVGLGLARNFSTGRPVFQNLAENVPVSGRAFWEADWDVNMQKEREKLRMKKFQTEKKGGKKASKEMLKPRTAERKMKVVTAEEERKADLDHYFPTAVSPDVTTHLLIPLVPTSTSRIPLAADVPVSSTSHPLLPLMLVGSIHTAHSTQALRVSSLFARLEAAHVFEAPGVHYEAHGDPSGVCTLLEVTFEGWDEARVRSVLGEAGQGWCVLEEVRKDQETLEQERMEEVLEAMSADGDASRSSGSEDHHWHQGTVVDPAHSLVLPTLDFSASFSAAVSGPVEPVSPPPFSTSSTATSHSSPFSDLAFHNAWSSLQRDASVHDTEAFSDASSDLGSFDVHSESSWAESDFDFGMRSARRLSPASQGSESWFGLGFSSEFSGRMQETGRSSEYLF